MDAFYRYLYGDLTEEELAMCRDKSKSFLEARYNRAIKAKFLEKYKKKYEEECIMRTKEGKKLKVYISKFFKQVAIALVIQQQYLTGKIKSIPKWVSSLLTKENLLNFMKSLPKQFDFSKKISEFATTELVLNFIFYCISYGVSWSQYFLFFKDGRDILYNALFKNELVSILAFTEAVWMVGVTKGYDETIFRKEFYTAFPDIEKYLFNDPSQSGIYRTVALFVVGKISFAVFRATVLKIAGLVNRR